MSLANKWAFNDIRDLAIAQLAPIASDVEKIVLGRKYAINEWLGAAYLAVCVREQSLTEEGKLMTVDDIIEINAIRQQFGTGAHPKVGPSLLMEDVCARFGLLTPASQSAATEALDPPSGLVAGSESQAISPAQKQIRSQEPVVLPEELNSEEKAKAAGMAREQAERLRQSTTANEALDVYFRRADVLSIDGVQWSALIWARDIIRKENELRLHEDCKQQLLNFINSYKSSNPS